MGRRSDRKQQRDGTKIAYGVKTHLAKVGDEFVACGAPKRGNHTSESPTKTTCLSCKETKAHREAMEWAQYWET